MQGEYFYSKADEDGVWLIRQRYKHDESGELTQLAYVIAETYDERTARLITDRLNGEVKS